MGNYFLNASLITSGLAVIGVVLITFAAVAICFSIWKKTKPLLVLLLALASFAQSCNYAKSNQKVLVSDDCGMNWKEIAAGDAVPKGTMNYCYMKVVIPNYPMQGQSKFTCNFTDKVRAKTHIDYDYSIVNGLAFMKQAKRLGSANSNVDSNDALNDAAFESAENSVIDVRLRDVAKEAFLTQDIVDLDQAELEEMLLKKANRILEPLGVQLNFITLTFDLDDQTRQAIDIATAMKIYDTKGLSDIGKSIVVARAGATKVLVENTTVQPTEKSSE